MDSVTNQATSMRAVLCHTNGPAESLVVENIDEPTPKSGYAVIRVHAAALNFPDVLMIQGKYQSQPPFPFSPGGEFAGTIESINGETNDFAVGDEVFGGIGHGAFAEKITAPTKGLLAKPNSMSFAQASGISTTYGTSYYALKQRAQLQPGENLLVLGAAGGVGLAAVELGKAMGARVIAAASTDEKLAVAATCGADELINYSDGELKEKVKSLTDGKGADVIYDPVGGELFDQCMRSINWNGRVLVVGFVGGDIPRVPTNLILLKNCQVVGVFYGAFSARFPKESRQNFKEIMEMFEAGRINPLVGQEFSFNEHVEALNCLEQRRAIGKVVLNITE